MDFLDIIKIYFCRLGEEISELLSNIWKAMKTKKWITIVSGIILFITGCFVWKPLCLLTILAFIKLFLTICIMLIPLILTLICLSFFLEIEEPKYPILTCTLSFICILGVFIISTYFAYDLMIRDIWYQPELWSEIINLK